jgi:putative methyltransferase (TIGR04325 family)
VIALIFFKKNYKFEGIYQSYDDVPSSGSEFKSQKWVDDTYVYTKNAIENSSVPILNHTLLPILAYLEFSKEKKMNILDFGGGIGIDYLNLKACFNDYILNYFIIENKEICQSSTDKFQEDNNIHFIPYEDFDKGVEKNIDVCYCNSALQYINDYKYILTKFVSFNPKYIVFERLSAGNNPTFYTGQKNIGGCLSYCMINIKELILFLDERGYDVLYEEKTSLKYEISNTHDSPPECRAIRTMNVIFQREKSEPMKSSDVQWPVTMEPTSCPRCGSVDSVRICSGKDFLYHVPGIYHAVECSSCGLWFQNPRPIYDDINKVYPPFYAPHLIADQSQKKNPTNKLSKIITKIGSFLNRIPVYTHRKQGISLTPTFVANGILLEIGCATGSKLELLRNEGWTDLHGIEMVPEAAKLAQERGFQVHCGRVEEVLASYPDHYFDVVIASMVLEHLQNPFDVVQKIAKKIKSNGQFLFSTICRDSLDKKNFGCYWAGFDFPRHMVYFRMSDIVSMLQPSFGDIKVFYQNAPIDFIRSASWRDSNKDKAIIVIMKYAGHLIGLMQIFTKSASRVSFRCKRKSV